MRMNDLHSTKSVMARMFTKSDNDIPDPECLLDLCSRS